MIRIHNTETDEIIDREMNAAEVAQYEADLAIHAATLAEIEAKESAKSALLQRLGLTDEEAKLLLS